MELIYKSLLYEYLLIFERHFYKNNLNTNESSTELNAIGNQIVFVKVTLENQQVFIKKAIVN